MLICLPLPPFCDRASLYATIDTHLAACGKLSQTLISLQNIQKFTIDAKRGKFFSILAKLPFGDADKFPGISFPKMLFGFFLGCIVSYRLILIKQSFSFAATRFSRKELNSEIGCDDCTRCNQRANQVSCVCVQMDIRIPKQEASKTEAIFGHFLRS